MLRGCEVPANRDGSQVIDLRPVRARSHDFAVPVELCCGAAAGAAGEVRFAPSCATRRAEERARRASAGGTGAAPPGDAVLRRRRARDPWLLPPPPPCRHPPPLGARRALAPAAVAAAVGRGHRVHGRRRVRVRRREGSRHLRDGMRAVGAARLLNVSSPDSCAWTARVASPLACPRLLPARTPPDAWVGAWPAASTWAGGWWGDSSAAGLPLAPRPAPLAYNPYACVAGGARACECPDGASVLHGAARCQLVAGGSFWLPCECAPDLSRAAEYTRRVAAVAAAGALVGVAVAVWFVRWARRPVGTRRQRRRAVAREAGERARSALRVCPHSSCRFGPTARRSARVLSSLLRSSA